MKRTQDATGHLETVGQMRIRHRDEFADLLRRVCALAKNSSEAARIIGMSNRNFNRECDKYGVDRPIAPVGRSRG